MDPSFLKTALTIYVGAIAAVSLGCGLILGLLVFG